MGAAALIDKRHVYWSRWLVLKFIRIGGEERKAPVRLRFSR